MRVLVLVLVLVMVLVLVLGLVLVLVESVESVELERKLALESGCKADAAACIFELWNLKGERGVRGVLELRGDGAWYAGSFFEEVELWLGSVSDSGSGTDFRAMLAKSQMPIAATPPPLATLVVRAPSPRERLEQPGVLCGRSCMIAGQDWACRRIPGVSSSSSSSAFFRRGRLVVCRRIRR